ncbi:hypothetical protein ADL00_19240 [Streptomyces sp. AS58]|uniref:hypothetical protein n=1 Tax=Streptomyces sp. AS58 TaxID=1519489 RepID=UPI0006B01150|nr:hypothetical protein [Streptomyces sp. AS58]KOV65735.1 hypothetical protein ADL00_19240 [Streptomyces sp. AS58]
MDKPRRGYWCECWTENLDEERRPALLASIDAYFAAQADRWVAVTLRTITPALDSEACDEAWDWLYEGRIETRRALLRSEPCTVSITQDRIRVTWTIRPVVFLPLHQRQGVELPACAYAFKPGALDHRSERPLRTTTPAIHRGGTADLPG